MARKESATSPAPPFVGSIGNRLFGDRPLDLDAPSNQVSELRALRVEVDRLRSRLAKETAHRAELEAALVNLTENLARDVCDDRLPDAFERFFNADDPAHLADRNFLLH